jgi:hypothetical protein
MLPCVLEISYRQLSVYYFVAPSQTRGRVSNLQLLLVLASAFPLRSDLSDERSVLSLCLLSVNTGIDDLTSVVKRFFYLVGCKAM